IEWMDFDYDLNTSIEIEKKELQIQILTNSFSGDVKFKQQANVLQKLQYAIADSSGKILLSGHSREEETVLQLKGVPFGVYFIRVEAAGLYGKVRKFRLGD
ncbi:MAG: hypothetical protein AB8B69_12500, partial [Chitinophagales bacterium]